eukprot:CAMPEP_0113453288 /NCGR_PEP_ID=MMETSP0014_2-20120614/7281_1 /TAXON_ID=2857 /ORGANISM="Nitzschia sp." /LENGTH=358 /DNA_ID=CAMNT_0000344679 /DNA_START=58 /DNA_END=1134 /DNA_ORIENTATION=- /assembly_acc=CAM_ASM_000159
MSTTNTGSSLLQPATSSPSLPSTAAPSSPALSGAAANHHVSSTVSFPRTGKRGVPQQFARRLYEMLQGEEKLELASSSADYPVYIKWSKSGLAFKIIDVDAFTARVLPKYFRTKKFSSFQRNLNLYGFSKVRRGPDTDMYAHPSFIRGKPELLFNLRKCATATKNRTVAAASNKKNDNTTGPSAAPKPRPQLKKRSKVARPSPALPTRRAPSLAASASASSSTPTSSSTCYESDDHSTGGTVISHEEDHATYHHLAERAGLNPSVAAAAATANQVYLKKKTKATPATARSTLSSPERRSWGGSQSALVSPSKYIPSQKPLLLMPKTGSTTPSSSSSTPPPSRPVMGGLDMLAMAVEFA